jgi:hypothetical protein
MEDASHYYAGVALHCANVGDSRQEACPQQFNILRHFSETFGS